ncbi:hypothetical protein Bca52824_059371 [Brassica carinata]|uniref:Uncharacterized protein n=1 Tax=Brassica carinata TaxID=52824 RepID=A0A8X7UI58_BRACI|nr:hypothetical protein Bca52824_059371 [Brassica carinata]
MIVELKERAMKPGIRERNTKVDIGVELWWPLVGAGLVAASAFVCYSKLSRRRPPVFRCSASVGGGCLPCFLRSSLFSFVSPPSLPLLLVDMQFVVDFSPVSLSGGYKSGAVSCLVLLATACLVDDENLCSQRRLWVLDSPVLGGCPCVGPRCCRPGLTLSLLSLCRFRWLWRVYHPFTSPNKSGSLAYCFGVGEVRCSFGWSAGATCIVFGEANLYRFVTHGFHCRFNTIFLQRVSCLLVVLWSLSDFLANSRLWV